MTLATRRIQPRRTYCVGKMGIELVHPKRGDLRLTSRGWLVLTNDGWVAKEVGR